MALFGLLSDNGLLSNPDANMALAAGLLGGRGNWGANLGQGLMGAMAAQQQERANRQNDLQQLQGLYTMLQSQEAMRMFQAKRAGLPYTPSPEFTAVQARIGQLAGANSLSVPGAPQAPSAPPQMPPQMPPQASPQSQGAPRPIAAQPGGMQPANAASNMPPSAPPSAPPAPQGGFGGQAGGLDPEDYMMGAMNPGLKMYTEQYAKAHMPISTKYGIFAPDPSNPNRFVPVGGALPQGAMPYSSDAQGNTVIAPLPGQLETQAKMAATGAAAKAAGEFPFKVENVQTASGATVPRLTQSVVGSPDLSSLSPIFGGKPLPQQPTIPQSVINADKSGQPFTATQAPGGPVQFQQGGPKADFFSDIPRSPQPQGIGQSTQAKTVSEELGKSYAETAKSLATDANAANQRMAYNAAALKALPNSVTGPGAANISQIKNFLVSRFGIPESVFSEGPSATQELNKALINAATQKAKSIYGARLAQQEVMMQVNQASPALGMTKAAIKTLLDMDNQLSQYSIQKANDFGEYYARGGNPLLFDGWYARKRPLSAEIDAGSPSAPAPASSASAGVRRYNPATGKIE